MLVSENLKKSNIRLKTKSKNRWDIIKEMVDFAVKNKEISKEDSEAVHTALIEREKSMSTGIGNGVAIPHCTSSRIEDVILLLTVSTNGIDFDAIDNHPVQIIILLLVPKNKLTQHIKTLANIAKIMSNKSLREELLEAKTADNVLKSIKKYEK